MTRESTTSPERRRTAPAAASGSRLLRQAPRRGQHLPRTILLGAVVVFLAIYWLASGFDMDRAELLGFAYTSVLLVGGLVVLATAGAAILWLIRRWFR